MDKSGCRACGKEIVWARTVRGKAQPFDAEPERRIMNAILPPANIKVEKRSVITYDAASGDYRAMVVDTWPALGSITGDEVDAYMPHHATCPRWRR